MPLSNTLFKHDHHESHYKMNEEVTKQCGHTFMYMKINALSEEEKKRNMSAIFFETTFSIVIVII